MASSRFQGTMVVFWTESLAPRHDDFGSKDFNANLIENALLAQVPTWEEGIILSSSRYTSYDSLDNKEEEGGKRSDAEHSYDLAFVPLYPMGEVVIAYSFRENSDFDTSLGEVNMASRFRTLGQKKSKPGVDPHGVNSSSQPSLVGNPCFSSSFDCPRRGQTEFIVGGPSIRSKKKKGKQARLSSFPPVFTPTSRSSSSLPPSSAVMLSKGVADLTKDGSKEI
ncbi:hypothetical protein Acr_00g0051700 [Actinidia rufa]|uniref:Uncharacterized protein n=1 Tax=Actinidia rufa TaxID=165716 RepID=A0A7J0DKZ5_9ERIC|nr:hypothetical protein Acr_00g0051700 [Actinidia rufa]